MGIENMRRWPMYIVFAVCILLLLSLFNSWSMETELSNRIVEISSQLKECSSQQTSCVKKSLTLAEERDNCEMKTAELSKQKDKLTDNASDFKNKMDKAEIQINRTLVELNLCNTEKDSLKSLQVSQAATLDTLRLKESTLTAQLAERKQKIEELEKEIEKLKTALTTKSAPNVPVSMKVTPAAQPPKLSPALNVNNPINEPVIENDAKEEMEDTNAINDPNEFDPVM